MAKKFETEHLSSAELAKHLKQPAGIQGKKIGLQMNRGNKHICLNSYKVLEPKKGDHILEIGMGNGFFVKDLLSMAEELTYVGADFSETMVKEAKEINSGVEKTNFYQASIEKLPFEDNQFDSITTTNTIYFWPNLEADLKELQRVLKPNGKLLIAYRDKNLMDKLEFTNYGFEKYDSSDVEELLKGNGFKGVETRIIPEEPLEFEGTEFIMEGMYTTGLNK